MNKKRKKPPGYRGGSTLTEERRAERGWGPGIKIRLPAGQHAQLLCLAAKLGLKRTEVIGMGLEALLFFGPVTIAP